MYGNAQYGIYTDSTSDLALLTGNTVYGVPGGLSVDDQSYGIYVTGASTTLSTNTVYNNGTGIYASGAGGRLGADPQVSATGYTATRAPA